MSKLVIEIDDKKNRSFTWGPTQDRVRGRYSLANMPAGATSESGITKMPDIPGHYIELDLQRKEGRIIDPLSREEAAEVLREARNTYKEVTGDTIVPCQDRTYPSLPELEVNTWLYWMARLVSQGQAVVKEGEVPPVAKIKGEYRTNFFDSSAYANQTRGGKEEAAATAS